MTNYHGNSSAGFTLLELMIALAVGTLVVSALLGAFPLILRQPVVQANKLAIEKELQYVRYWLAYDGNRAETFVPQSAPDYGYFQWRDYTGETMVTYQAYYKYDAAATSLMRELKAGSVSQGNYYLAKNLLTYSSASFSWQPSTQTILVTLSPTIQDAPAIGDTIRTTTITVNLRPESEPLYSAPGDLPLLPPPPGSEYYYIAANPIINIGSYVSGNAASLHDADSNYYVVSAATGPGGKQVDWQAVSERITAPLPMGDIQVRYTGQSSAANVTMEFYIKNSDAGFPIYAESGFTFSSRNQDVTKAFYVSSEALAYINQVKEITIKIVATGSGSFNLSTDQVVFVVSP